MQIGELSTRLSDEFKDETSSQIQWGPIKSMRNMFAHDYASMDKETVWETSKRDIPALLRFCEKVMEQNTPQPAMKPLKPKDRGAR
jgi:uncharacterized protein with HEPN domain